MATARRSAEWRMGWRRSEKPSGEEFGKAGTFSTVPPPPRCIGWRNEMKTVAARLLAALLFFVSIPWVHAATEGASNAPTGWHAKTLLEALGLMLLFTFVGVLAAIGGYKIFDKCTPGDMHKEIIENKNVAMAIVAAAVILGVCIIVAAAIVG